MFIFAAAYSLSKKIGLPLKMGLYNSGHDKFGSNQIHYIFPSLRNDKRILKHYISFLKDITKNNTKINIYNENDKQPNKEQTILMTGYFQNFSFFKDNINEIKDIFTFNDDIINNINTDHIKLLKECKTIGIHIRHGDMLRMMLQSNGYVKFPILKKKYYIDCLEKIKNLKNYKILFFTDTAHSWINRSFIPHYKNSFLIENNKNDEDLYLMSQCDYLIISNSTLSYWAGIIGKTKKVFAPKYVMNIGGKNKLKFKNIDYYPNNWNIIDNFKTSIWKLEENNIN